MVSLGGVFDAAAPENQSPSSVVPAGEYEVIAIASEVKNTNDGSGRFLNMQFQITKGEFQNRRIFHRFNLWLAADKEKAIAIAKGQFSEFCRAVGVLTPSDSSELHNKSCLIRVNVKSSEGYGDQNNITKFSAKAQASAPVVAAPAQGSGW